MDPATRRLALIAAGLGAALLVLIGAWSMTGPPQTGLPVIAPQAGPLREKPAHPGGMQVAGSGQAIFGHAGGAGDTASGGVMAPPERPDLAALRAPPAPPPAPAATAVPRTSPDARPVVPAPPALGAALPLPPVFPTRLPQAARAVADRSAIGAPGMVAPVPRPLPAPAASAGDVRAASGAGSQVQLAALPTRAAAVAEWHLLRQRMPGLLAHHRLVLAEAKVGGHVWWRVRTAGFADRGAARHFCARARAAGAACDVTSF